MPPAVGRNLGLHLEGSPHFLSELIELEKEGIPRHLVFDIETLGEKAPRGSVTSVFMKTPSKAYAFYGGKKDAPRLTLSEREAATILRTLEDLRKKGTKIVGWNTSGFDFQELGIKSGMLKTASNLARNTFDLMYQVLSTKGFPLGLEKVGMALGVKKRTDIDPAIAWAQGKHQQTIERGISDVVIAEKGLLYVEKHGRLPYIPEKEMLRIEAGQVTEQAAKRRYVKMKRLMTPNALLQMKQPDTTWMKEAPALTRESAISWTTAKHLTDAHFEGAWATAKAAGRNYTSDDVTALFMNKAQRFIRHNKTGFIAGGVGLGLIGSAALLGKIVSRPSKAPKDRPIPFPEMPMPIGAVEDQALFGLASQGMAPAQLMHAEGLMPEPREEGLHSIGDFGKWFKELFRTGKGGLVQDLHKNACRAGIRDPREKYWALGNCAVPYSPPAQHPVRSRAGVL